MQKLRLWTVTVLLPSFLFLPIGIASDVPFADVPFDVNNIPDPVPPPKEVRAFFDLDPFYQQWINVGGFPVLASEKVSPYAVKEAAWLIKQMMGHRSDILKAMAGDQQRFTIIAHNEMTSDIPELGKHLAPHFFFNVRNRGGACWYLCKTTFGPEEQALHGNDIILHEMAHSIHAVALNQQIDPTFDNRLKTLYSAAIEKGLYLGTYASTNRDEYWAEGVGSWFHAAGLDNPVKTRDAMKVYDPSLALLIAEVFGDHDWRYTPIQMRIHLPHLQGFDPRSAPWTVWPPGVLEVYEDLYNPSINERNEWVNLPAYDPSLISILNESRTRGSRTDILFVNLSGSEILLYWIFPDGTEKLARRSPPEDPITQFAAGVGSLMLVKDLNSSPLAVFQAVEKTGRALVAPTLTLITPGLSKISGDNQAGLSGAVLANPFVIEIRDENLSGLEGISVTFTVTVGDGTLSVTSTTTDENGRAESTLTLGTDVGTTTVSVSAAGIEQPVTFNAVAEVAVDIPDPNLRAVLETALRVSPGTPIVSSEMETLIRLEARDANIRNLTGLEGATNLKDLRLDRNAISDISVLAGLTDLTGLGLDENSISDISALAGLTNLTNLFIGGNNISDISVLAGLTNLRGLSLYNNNISDISAVTELTDLTRLWLDGNNISDISPLVANTGLGVGGEVYLRRWNPLSYLLYPHPHSLRSAVEELQ